MLIRLGHLLTFDAPPVADGQYLYMFTFTFTNHDISDMPNSDLFGSDDLTVWIEVCARNYFSDLQKKYAGAVQD